MQIGPNPPPKPPPPPQKPPKPPPQPPGQTDALSGARPAALQLGPVSPPSAAYTGPNLPYDFENKVTLGQGIGALPPSAQSVGYVADFMAAHPDASVAKISDGFGNTFIRVYDGNDYRETAVQREAPPVAVPPDPFALGPVRPPVLATGTSAAIAAAGADGLYDTKDLAAVLGAMSSDIAGASDLAAMHNDAMNQLEQVLDGPTPCELTATQQQVVKDLLELPAGAAALAALSAATHTLNDAPVSDLDVRGRPRDDRTVNVGGGVNLNDGQQSG